MNIAKSHNPGMDDNDLWRTEVLEIKRRLHPQTIVEYKYRSKIGQNKYSLPGMIAIPPGMEKDFNLCNEIVEYTATLVSGCSRFIPAEIVNSIR